MLLATPVFAASSTEKTTNTIVCSELLHIAYPQVAFVARNALGSFAITPDHIELRAGADEADPLQLVLFGHDGKLMFDNGSDSKFDHNGVALYEKLVKGKPMQGEDNRPSVRSSFTGFL